MRPCGLACVLTRGDSQAVTLLALAWVMQFVQQVTRGRARAF